MEHKNIDDCEFIAIKTAIIRSYRRHGPCRLMNVGDLHHVLEKTDCGQYYPPFLGILMVPPPLPCFKPGWIFLALLLNRLLILYLILLQLCALGWVKTTKTYIHGILLVAKDFLD